MNYRWTEFEAAVFSLSPSDGERDQGRGELFARDEDSDQQAHAKGNPDRLIGMLANRTISSFSCFDGFIFQPLRGDFGRVESSREALAQFDHFFTGMIGRGFH